MTTMTFRSAALAALLASAPVVAAGQTPALERGSYALGGSAGFTIQDNGAGENAFTFSAVPRVEYFFLDGLALGGHLGLSRSTQGESSSTALYVGPIASYYFVQGGRAHPFVRALAAYTRRSFSSPITDGSFSSLALTGAVGLLYMLSDAVGVDAQLFVRSDRLESGTGAEAEATSGGLQIGFSAFVL